MIGIHSVEDLSVDEIYELVARAGSFMDSGAPPDKGLRDRIVINAFFEPSTRTRVSFAIATARLGSRSIEFDADTSSESKGEQLRDTFQTLSAMGPDVFVVRHRLVGTPRLVEEWTGTPVINGGDGRRGHPTQTLVDIMTIHRAFGTLEGLRIGVVGDVVNSRVARGLLGNLGRLGASVIAIGPSTLVPDPNPWRVAVARELDPLVPELDVVYALRLQKERGTGSAITGVSRFRERYGVTNQRAEEMKPGARIMHAGPMNRGVEIDSGAADSPRSLVLSQVANGIPMRMACLEKVLGANR